MRRLFNQHTKRTTISSKTCRRRSNERDLTRCSNNSLLKADRVYTLLCHRNRSMHSFPKIMLHFMGWSK
jgi:hypothetical protein